MFRSAEVTLTDLVAAPGTLDVRDPQAVRQAVADLRPDVVLHLAAATDVDRCEQEPDWAYHHNTVGTQNVALACQATGCTLVFISTAAVFPGDKPEPYVEFDEPGPVSVYGRTKLCAERIVSSLLSRYYIVRGGWMIGGGPKDKKFVGKIVEKIRAGEKRLRVVNDKFGSTTYAKDFLQGIRSLIETDQFGLYHLVNTGMASRYEVALAIREILGASDVEIEPIPSSRFPLPAPRGRSEALRTAMFDLLGLHPMRPCELALRDYIESELAPKS